MLMDAILLFFAIFSMNISCTFGAEPTAVVNTTYGPVQGEIQYTVMRSMRYSSFTGIRYAQPPTGWNRFKPPIPARRWHRVYQATTEGPECIQAGGADATIEGSEDCLFLNVFTPYTNLEEPPTDLKAVMIWVYGGAWSRGSSTLTVYGPDFLLEKDVVVVSFNHRVGTLGFLNMNHPNATGNAGLKDQRLAFKWVQANIAEFGGNPNNVTVLGGSSGGMSAAYHTISAGSAGLFHATITLSGSLLIPWAFQTAAAMNERIEELAAWLGINSTDRAALLEELYSTPAADLAAGAFWIKEKIAFSPSIENASIAEDPILTECFLKHWYTGNFTKIPQMLGFLHLETVGFACPGVDAHIKTIDSYIEMSQDIGFEVPQSLYTFKEIYGNGTNDWGLFNASLIEETIALTSDLLFIAPIDMTQQILVAYNDNKPIYYYHTSFDYIRSLHTLRWNCSFKGPGHGDDIGYVFTCPEANYPLNLSDPLALTRDRVTTLFTNFAKYGNPTPDWVDDYNLNVTWPESGMFGIALEIGNELTVGPRPLTDNQRLIESYAWPYLPSVADCHG